MLEKLNHIAIAVPNLKTAIKSYKENFDAKISKIRDLPEHGVRTAFVHLPNTNVEFSIDGKPQSFETEIIDRKTLTGGAQKAGPNVIYQEDSTTVVPPGWTMSVDDDLTLRLRKLDNKNE